MIGGRIPDFGPHFGRLVVGALVVACTAAAFGEPAVGEWKYQQHLAVPGAGLVRIAVPAETLDHGRPGLPDLRILGPDGQEVPYAIEIATPPKAVAQAPRGFHVELQRSTTQLTLETGTSRALESVRLATPTSGFVKAAQVEISADGREWERVADGVQIARGERLEQTTLPLPKTPAAFIRITINDDRTPVVPFTGATLRLAPSDDEPTIPVAADMVKREEFARETVITLDLHARHLALASIAIDARDPLFSRLTTVTERQFANGQSSARILTSGIISRSRLSGMAERESLALPVTATIANQELQVHLLNENNAPLDITAITVRRRPVWVIFTASATGNYTWLLGNARIEAPRYDLSVFAERLRTVAESTLRPTDVEPNPGYNPVDQLAEAPMYGAPLDASAWKFRRVVTPGAHRVQELELDLAVLAHAKPDLGDLRLLHDGRQVPYLVERTNLHRTFAAVISPQDDPKEPRLSRWKLELPLSRVPVNQLSLTSDSALFSRVFQIYELLTNDRGETWRRALASPIRWNVTPDQPNRTLIVPLQATPESTTLYLETDNGDNPPIQLRQAQFEHAVVRLFFRAEGGVLQLCYGNPAAIPPNYDLRLVAEQVIADEASRAELGAEESTAGSTLDLSGVKGGIVLWGSLALVVVVLLVAIARLLPKSPPRPPG